MYNSFTSRILNQKYLTDSITKFLPTGNDVETVVLLGWKDVDEYMYVDYEPDHHIVEQGKATYREVTEEKEKAILDAFKHFGML